MKSSIDLKQQIFKIKDLITELSPSSSGVQEFYAEVKKHPELLKHFGFDDMNDLEEFVNGASYQEFQELVSDTEYFLERRKRYFKSEMDEFERVTQDLNREENINVSVNDIVSAFEKAIEIKIPEKVWKELENTECNQIKKGEMNKVIQLAKKYNKQDPKELKKALSSGEYRRPLILKYKDKFRLVAGNTRLCTAAAMGMRPQVLIAEL